MTRSESRVWGLRRPHRGWKWPWSPGPQGGCLLGLGWASSGAGVGVGPGVQIQAVLELELIEAAPPRLPPGLCEPPSPSLHTHLCPPLLPCHVVTSIWVCVGQVPGGLWKLREVRHYLITRPREGGDTYGVSLVLL